MPRCKHGKLKNPVGRRRCKKAPKKGRKKKGTKAYAGKCAHGKLKNRVRTKSGKGWRYCKRAPKRRSARR
jgi:hypothetical protein